MCIPWAIYMQRTRFETMLLGSFKIPPGVCWIFQKLFILEGFDMGEVTFLVHMHKHGFFIPDVKYSVDPKGFLAYLGLKVKRYYMCLYCNGGCHPFGSFEAVQKHIKAKSNFKVHYGDGGDDEEAELDEFYDYSRRLHILAASCGMRRQTSTFFCIASTLLSCGICFSTSLDIAGPCLSIQQTFLAAGFEEGEVRAKRDGGD